MRLIGLMLSGAEIFIAFQEDELSPSVQHAKTLLPVYLHNPWSEKILLGEEVLSA
ncbi:hypothetical protein ACE6H2_019804 [Prunus campanulata]